MKRLRAITILALISTITYSCKTVKLVEEESTATIAISASSRGPSASGSGIVIEIMNIETKERVRSTSLGKLSNHSVLLQVKEGTYIVTGLELPIGRLVFKQYDKAVSDYFGTIEVEKGERYYLGFYRGKQKLGLKNRITLSFKEAEVPQKLVQKFQEADKVQANRTFTSLQPAQKEPLRIN